MVLDKLPHLCHIALRLLHGVALMHSEILHSPASEQGAFGSTGLWHFGSPLPCLHLYLLLVLLFLLVLLVLLVLLFLLVFLVLLFLPFLLVLLVLSKAQGPIQLLSSLFVLLIQSIGWRVLCASLQDLRLVISPLLEVDFVVGFLHIFSHLASP